MFRTISWMSWITIQPASLSVSFLLQGILPQMWAQHFHGSMNCPPTHFFFTVSHSSRLLCSVQVAMRKYTINTLEALVSYSLICLCRGSVESIFTQWEDVLGTRILSLFWIFLPIWKLAVYLNNKMSAFSFEQACDCCFAILVPVAYLFFFATIPLFWQLHSFFFFSN